MLGISVLYNFSGSLCKKFATHLAVCLNVSALLDLLAATFALQRALERHCMAYINVIHHPFCYN